VVALELCQVKLAAEAIARCLEDRGHVQAMVGELELCQVRLAAEAIARRPVDLGHVQAMAVADLARARGLLMGETGRGLGQIVPVAEIDRGRVDNFLET
jgi:hypothetical protein